MLKIKMIPVLSRMISKLDLKPVVEVLKNADVFDNAKGKSDAVKQLSGEKAAELAFDMLMAITPQADRIGEDIPEFVAFYKGITIEEAGDCDMAEVFREVLGDAGIKSFFGNALRKKAERTL